MLSIARRSVAGLPAEGENLLDLCRRTSGSTDRESDPRPGRSVFQFPERSGRVVQFPKADAAANETDAAADETDAAADPADATADDEANSASDYEPASAASIAHTHPGQAVVDFAAESVTVSPWLVKSR